MSETAHTPLKSEQDDNNVAPKSSGPKASSRTPSKSANKKNGVNLTPVESLLFFNIVRFNKDPSSIDWDQVAKHSNLKNPSSAKVRFRQIQKKYGLEVNPAPRPGKRKTRAAATEDDEECEDDEDDEDTDESPSKKRSNDLSTRGNASQSRASRKKAVVQKEPDSEDDAPASTGTRAPVSNPDKQVKQGHHEQQTKEQDDPDIKQESPVCQVQMMRPSPAHPNGQPHRPQQQQQQQQRGHERLSLAGNASGTYNMEDAQRSGGGMFRGVPPFQHAPSMASSHQSQVLTPQQQAYLGNLQRLHHERVAQQDPYMGYGHSEPQAHPSAYMTQQAGGQYGQYGQYGVAPTYTNPPQAYYSPQTQTGGVQPLTRPPTRAPSRAQTQSPAVSLREDKPVRSSGDGSFASAPESPIHPLFDEGDHMPNLATH